MNRTIGMVASAANAAAVAAFSLCMIVGQVFGSYLASMFIAFSFVPMMSAFCFHARQERKVAGQLSVAFGVLYSALILIVYYAQVTTVASGGLSRELTQLLDYSRFGLFFNYDLLGYGIMALATFFAGLTMEPISGTDRWLKWLLIIHGAFFFSSFILPLLGLFGPDMDGADWIGTAVLQFWCVYFAPIGVLSFFHFRRKGS